MAYVGEPVPSKAMPWPVPGPAMTGPQRPPMLLSKPKWSASAKFVAAAKANKAEARLAAKRLRVSAADACAAAEAKRAKRAAETRLAAPAAAVIAEPDPPAAADAEPRLVGHLVCCPRCALEFVSFENS
jgi:hypothetical protein